MGLRNDQPTDKVNDLRMCIAELVKVWMGWQNDVLESTNKNSYAKAGFIDSLQIEEEYVLPQVQQYWEDLQTKGFIWEDIYTDA